MRKDKEARAKYMMDYREKQKREAEAGITSGSVNPPSKPVNLVNLDVILPDPAESMLGAVNVVLERKGYPKVHKGVEPDLPFGKKVQASRKRM